jgi:MoCo/4Fe-4S cofactor protein with predicted Tat translocation signal
MSHQVNPASPSPGPPHFWRSLDELQEADAFQELLAREFPSLLPLAQDVESRRNFLKLLGASLALAGVSAGASGCARRPEETIVPYVHMPEELAAAEPLYFATALPRAGDALGLLVKSYMGRPIKIEGNPDHPASQGATDALAQASLLDLYDPDRSQTVLRSGLIETWGNFLAALGRERERWRRQAGRGLRILTETVSSPSLAALIEQLLEAFPEARWHQYQPVNDDACWEGARLAFGRPLDAVYRFDRAGTVLTLDADVLQDQRGSVRYARDFIYRRQLPFGEQPANRLYAVESTPTITGAMADHRLALSPPAITALVIELARRLGVEGLAAAPSPREQVPAPWMTALLGDLQRVPAIVVAGRSQPPAVHALVYAINERLRALGQTITLIEPVAARPENHQQSLHDLVQAMRAGEVESLVIISGNPVYTAPHELSFAEALRNVKWSVHLSGYVDETSLHCHWHVPEAHYLESWLDARAFDGTVSIVQPLIAPLYLGKTPHQLLAALGDDAQRSSQDLVRDYWRNKLPADDFERTWRRIVHDGLMRDSAAPAVEAELMLQADRLPFPERSATGGGEVTIEFRPDPSLRDGRSANNGWLQELPSRSAKSPGTTSPASALARPSGWESATRK